VVDVTPVVAGAWQPFALAVAAMLGMVAVIAIVRWVRKGFGSGGVSDDHRSNYGRRRWGKS